MIQIEAFAFNAFQVNTLLVWDDSGDCLVVDPSFYDPAEQDQFEAFLKEKGLSLKGQVNTHCHVDHVLGVDYIRQTHGLPFRAHEQESKIAHNSPLMGKIFGWEVDPLGEIDEFISDGQEIMVGTHKLMALAVPGHSPGSLAFYSVEGRFVITGDALFRQSIGRTDLPGGDYDTLMASIRDKLLALPPETVIYPGHGPTSSIAEERQSNPFLQEIG